MAGSDIEEFYATHKALYEFLLEARQPTFANSANDNFRRSLVLAIASSFEHGISEIIRGIPAIHAGDSPIIRGMIEKKFLARQYHTYFDWDKTNANSFFGLFGSAFVEKAKQQVRQNPQLEQAVRDFLELGNLRNRLVHLDYVTFDVDKSPEDIMRLYRSAVGFVEFIRIALLGTTETEAAKRSEGQLAVGEVDAVASEPTAAVKEVPDASDREDNGAA